MRELQYTTPHGIAVTRKLSKAPFRKGLRHLLRELDSHRGVYLSSGYEFPGRYSRWDIAAVCPPLELISTGRKIEFRPLNERGEALVRIFAPILAAHPHWESCELTNSGITGILQPMPFLFSEEERSKQPSVFSILRTLIAEFRDSGDSKLALIGAFGYDLIFQFEPA